MIRYELPKISCLMVSTGRVDHVPRSTMCYLNQTYPHKELIVLSQGSAEDNVAIREQLGDRDDIKFFVAPSRLTLGAMRNLSCELASGDVLCQWDDDDLYHPTRIMDQYKALCADSRNVASASSKFLKYFSHTNDLYWCDWWGEGVPSSRFLCGSVMFRKSIFHKHNSMLYPESGNQCHVEEDLNVLNKLLEAGKVVSYGNGHHYLYAYHGENTYALSHHLLAIETESGKEVAGVNELLTNRILLEDTLRSMGVGFVSVRSLDEVAFTYNP